MMASRQFQTAAMDIQGRRAAQGWAASRATNVCQRCQFTAPADSQAQVDYTGRYNNRFRVSRVFCCAQPFTVRDQDTLDDVRRVHETWADREATAAADQGRDVISLMELSSLATVVVVGPTQADDLCPFSCRPQ